MFGGVEPEQSSEEAKDKEASCHSIHLVIVVTRIGNHICEDHDGDVEFSEKAC